MWRLYTESSATPRLDLDPVRPVLYIYKWYISQGANAHSGCVNCALLSSWATCTAATSCPRVARPSEVSKSNTKWCLCSCYACLFCTFSKCSGGSTLATSCLICDPKPWWYHKATYTSLSWLFPRVLVSPAQAVSQAQPNLDASFYCLYHVCLPTLPANLDRHSKAKRNIQHLHVWAQFILVIYVRGKVL